MESAFQMLQGVASAFPVDIVMQLMLARGAVNAIAVYSSNQRWDDMRPAVQLLQQMAGRFPNMLISVFWSL